METLCPGIAYENALVATALRSAAAFGVADADVIWKTFAFVNDVGCATVIPAVFVDVALLMATITTWLTSPAFIDAQTVAVGTSLDVAEIDVSPNAPPAPS
jgi:hypothetical protein